MELDLTIKLVFLLRWLYLKMQNYEGDATGEHNKHSLASLNILLRLRILYLHLIKEIKKVDFQLLMCILTMLKQGYVVMKTYQSQFFSLLPVSFHIVQFTIYLTVNLVGFSTAPLLTHFRVISHFTLVSFLNLTQNLVQDVDYCYIGSLYVFQQTDHGMTDEFDTLFYDFLVLFCVSSLYNCTLPSSIRIGPSLSAALKFRGAEGVVYLIF